MREVDSNGANIIKHCLNIARVFNTDNLDRDDETHDGMSADVSGGCVLICVTEMDMRWRDIFGAQEPRRFTMETTGDFRARSP